MAEWFFRKKSKGEVERGSAVQAFVRGKGLTGLANQ